MASHKIVIPTDGKNGLGERVAEHFGRSRTYTFLNEAGEVLEIIENTSEHRGGQGLPPELMKKHGADILLCRDLGPRALNLCADLGISVYTGAAATVGELYNLWNNDKLMPAGPDSVCSRHKS